MHIIHFLINTAKCCLNIGNGHRKKPYRSQSKHPGWQVDASHCETILCRCNDSFASYSPTCEISPMHAVPHRIFLLLQEQHEVGRRNVGHVLWSVRTGKGKLDLSPLMHSSGSHDSHKLTRVHVHADKIQIKCSDRSESDSFLTCSEPQRHHGNRSDWDCWNKRETQRDETLAIPQCHAHCRAISCL